MQHSLPNRLSDFVLRHGLISGGDHVLVAVSGGPDSIALLHLLAHQRESLAIGRISVLHFNHRLRGAESDADRVFVRSVAEKMELPIICAEEDVRRYRQGRGVSMEMAARERRHRFFRRSLDQCAAQRIALGHTSNDQAEEVLLRLLRGVGPSGMEGMLPLGHEGVIRPLLFAARAEILEYLHDLRIPFREDSSNLEPVCRRNVLRLQVLPLLEKHFHPHLVRTLSRHARLVAEEESWWSDRMRAMWPQVCPSETSERIELDREALRALHPALQRRVFRHAVERFRGHLMGISTAHVLALCRLAATDASGKEIHLPGGLRAVAEGHRIFLALASDGAGPVVPAAGRLIVPAPGRYDYAGMTIDIRKEVSAKPGSGALPTPVPNTAHMDADAIRWPMTIRSWKPGDRFRPLGLHGTKKLQDFFTDSKIPRSERRRIPLLCDGEKICWVVGRRLDDRVKVTPRTKEIIVAELI